MSKLLNGIATPIPCVDPRLHEKVFVASTCDIPENVQEAFSLVTLAVAIQLEKEHKDFGFPITCIFSDADSFTVVVDPEQVAMCVRIAFFPLTRLLQYNVLYTIIAEEFCHLLWNITDEVLVNYKVFEVLSNVLPVQSLQDLGYI